MTMLRRGFLAATAAAAIFSVPAACLAQDWKAQYPTLNVGVIPSENQQWALARAQGLADYLNQRLGVPVKLHTANDYAGIIEAIRARKIEIAYFGPASYAKAYEVTNGNVDPLVIEKDANGNAFYHSTIIVKSDSPYKTVADLKGKSLAFADPNSTSGYVVPSYFLAKEGIAPASFFGRTGFAGGHDNGALAVVNGQYDAAAVWWRSERDSVFQRMMEKKMIPEGSVRVVWTSPKLPESPWTARKDLPQDLRDQLRAAFVAMSSDAPDALKTLTDGKSSGFAPTNHDAFVEIIEMIKFNEAQRRKS